MNAIAKVTTALNQTPWTANSRELVIKLMTKNFKLTPDDLTGILGTSIRVTDPDYQDLVTELSPLHAKLLNRKQDVLNDFLKEWEEDSNVANRAAALQRLTSALSGADSIFYWGANEVYAKMA